MPADNINRTISFRLSPELHDKIVRLAKESGVSKHQFANTIVALALEGAGQPAAELDLSGVEDAFGMIQASLADFRMAVGRGIGALLQDVNPKRNREEIRRWVFERIITPSRPPEAGEGDPP